MNPHIALLSGIALLVAITYVSACPVRNKLLLLLEEHNIDFESWAYDARNGTIETLIEGIQSGEVRIESRNDGHLIMHMNIVTVTVTHTHDGREWELQEAHDVLHPRCNNGFNRRLKPGENPRRIARQHLAEVLAGAEPRFADELSYDLDTVGHETIGPIESISHPGLSEIHHVIHFRCEAGSLYKCKYKVRDRNKEAYFIWHPCARTQKVV